MQFFSGDGPVFSEWCQIVTAVTNSSYQPSGVMEIVVAKRSSPHLVYRRNDESSKFVNTTKNDEFVWACEQFSLSNRKVVEWDTNEIKYVVCIPLPSGAYLYRRQEWRRSVDGHVGGSRMVKSMGSWSEGFYFEVLCHAF